MTRALDSFRGTEQGSRRSPAKRVRREKEEQRSERVLDLLGGNERYGACDDVKQDKGTPPLPASCQPLLPAVRAVSRGCK